jgi:acetyl-CoA C-acetyltransferase
VEVKQGKETIIFDTDEHPRRGLTIEKLAKLRPAFKEGGSVTAANSSGINDGAAAVLMMSEDKARELGCKPLMELVAYAVAGYEDILMGYTPYFATKKLLEKVKLTIADIDLVELNEAFASQSVAVIRDLGLDPAKVNVNGGAIAMGHPVGASGCILPVKMIHEMQRTKAKVGLVTMCIGGGQGIAALFRNLQ